MEGEEKGTKEEREEEEEREREKANKRREVKSILELLFSYLQLKEWNT